MPGPVAAGLSIGALFYYARQVAREAKMHEIRAKTMAVATQNRVAQEGMSRQQNLQRMRSITQAQLGSQLAQSGVPYGSYYGGADSVPMSTFIARSAGM